MSGWFSSFPLSQGYSACRGATGAISGETWGWHDVGVVCSRLQTGHSSMSWRHVLRLRRDFDVIALPRTGAGFRSTVRSDTDAADLPAAAVAVRLGPVVAGLAESASGRSGAARALQRLERPVRRHAGRRRRGDRCLSPPRFPPCSATRLGHQTDGRRHARAGRCRRVAVGHRPRSRLRQEPRRCRIRRAACGPAGRCRRRRRRRLPGRPARPADPAHPRRRRRPVRRAAQHRHPIRRAQGPASPTGQGSERAPRRRRRLRSSGS